MEIETKNASLDTLAVTIMALHVSGKQMTQAVFKQLPSGEEQDGDQLWGVVRYQMKDGPGIWLVFSSGERLYRRGLEIHHGWRGNGVPKAKIALAKYDEKWGKYKPYDDAQAIKIAADRMHLALNLEEEHDYWMEELARQAKDVALSKLPQLFIAV